MLSSLHHNVGGAYFSTASACVAYLCRTVCTQGWPKAKHSIAPFILAERDLWSLMSICLICCQHPCTARTQLSTGEGFGTSDMRVEKGLQGLVACFPCFLWRFDLELE